MDEVAPFTVVAIALLREGVAALGLVAAIALHVDPQLLRAMSELASTAIGTEALLCEVFAE